MDFLLDNSQFARVKWLGRNSGQPGKSVYLSEFVPECLPSRLSVNADEIVGASSHLAAKGTIEAENADRPARKRQRFNPESESILTASYRGDGNAIEEPTNQKQQFEKEGHMRQARYMYLLLPLFFVLACAGAFAQANSEITGIVTDQTGAVVAGAKIVVTDPGTGESRTTASGATVVRHSRFEPSQLQHEGDRQGL